MILPQLIDFKILTADNINLIVKEYLTEFPYVVNTYPAPNSIVDATCIDTIRIEFSQPMRDGMDSLKDGFELKFKTK